MDPLAWLIEKFGSICNRIAIAAILDYPLSMSGFSVLVVGLTFGLRHAVDADHIAVVSTLLQHEPGAARAARIAALWGAGHTAALLAVGLAIVVAGVQLPPQFGFAAELLVAVMLLVLGGLHLVRAMAAGPPTARPGGAIRARPLAMGLVHGLGGSAAIALVTSTTIDSRAWAAVYLALFSVGTVAGMVLLTVLLSWPIAWSARRQGRGQKVAAAVAAALSLGLGVFMGIDLLAGA
jgi:high-affinity nickel permease